MVNKCELHLISTGKQSVDKFVETIEKVHKQVDFIHIRERKWSAVDHIKAINKLKERFIPLNKIIINDRIDIAHVMECTSVQLASHSIDLSLAKEKFPSFQIGCSVHSVKEAIEKEKAGAHRLIFGHVFSTASKPDLAPRGLSKLSQVVQAVNIPVIAIGGIKPSNVKDVLRTGAKGVAVLSGVLLADDPIKAVDMYRKQMKRS